MRASQITKVIMDLIRGVLTDLKECIEKQAAQKTVDENDPFNAFMMEEGKENNEEPLDIFPMV